MNNQKKKKTRRYIKQGQERGKKPRVFVSVGHTEKLSNSAMVPPRPTLDLAEAVEAFRGWSG